MYDPKFKKYDDLFKVKKLLGFGSCGQVLKSISKLDNQTYAVKLFQMRMLELQNISYEAEVMMRAKSDYTVELLDHFYDEEQQKYILVMPYYNKGNLSKYISKQWSRLDILSFLYQMCMAFLCFDKKGACWHLDLKPDNILVKNQGQYLICDFGCAKLVDNINHSKFLEMSMNRGIGTTEYAAPQLIFQMKGSRFSDMWSLGIILYKIIYKKHPFGDKIRENLSRYIKQGCQIKFEAKEGLEQLIFLCQKMLEPIRRLEWQQLRRKIYEFVGLPLKVQIVTNIERFISYAQNSSKIVLGLIYYLQKNSDRLQKLDFWKNCLKVISVCKTFVWALYVQVQNVILTKISESKEQKANISFYYVFPQIQNNFTIQKKQRLDHLRGTSQKFCKSESQQNANVSFYNIKMSFQSDLDDFVKDFRIKGLEKQCLAPIYEWQKIIKICSFISLKNSEKKYGLEFADKNQIQSFANNLLLE